MPYTNKSRSLPKMQRAHFEFIAAILKENKPSPANIERWTMWCNLASMTTDRLASTNPNFRRDDFLSACGL